MNAEFTGQNTALAFNHHGGKVALQCCPYSTVTTFWYGGEKIPSLLQKGVCIFILLSLRFSVLTRTVASAKAVMVGGWCGQTDVPGKVGPVARAPFMCTDKGLGWEAPGPLLSRVNSGQVAQAVPCSPWPCPYAAVLSPGAEGNQLPLHWACPAELEVCTATLDLALPAPSGHHGTALNPHFSPLHTQKQHCPAQPCHGGGARAHRGQPDPARAEWFWSKWPIWRPGTSFAVGQHGSQSTCNGQAHSHETRKTVATVLAFTVLAFTVLAFTVLAFTILAFRCIFQPHFSVLLFPTHAYWLWTMSSTHR